jgi:RNA polymerase sigma-70 factor (ECF subfamily)
LVGAAQAGDRRAYEALFERYAERLLLYVRLRLGAALRGKVSPFDVLQETFLAAHKAFAEFDQRDEDSFSHWIHRIAHNRIRDLADHHGAQRRAPAGGHLDGSGVIERIRASQTGPSTRAGREEEQRRLEQAIQALEPREREALLLRYFEGQSFERVGQALGCSRETARAVVGTAQVKLGSALERGL